MTHPDSPEFLAILERVPRWHMLTPDDKIQDGDYKIEAGNIGQGQEVFMDKIHWAESPENLPFVFRTIPEHVRRSEAWWALYNQLATVAPNGEGFAMYINSYGLALDTSMKCHGIRKFEISDSDRELFQERISILGGEAEIIKNLQEGPGAYMRWVLEVK